jgi:hypothetical protein
MNSDYRKIIAKSQNDCSYLYYKVIGDGHCFINCYLEACCKKYRDENNIVIKSKIARKMRLDFANFLLSKSIKSAEEISARLNIINPVIMCKFIGYEDKDKSSYNDLDHIKSLYDPKDPFIYDFIYGLIMTHNFILFETGQKLTFEDIKKLYETDHRILVAKTNFLSSAGTEPDDPSIYGYGKIPIDIGYYEITDGIGAGYNEFLQSINVLLSPTEYLGHIESSLFASYIGINVIIFPVGSYYKTYQKLIEYIQDAPELLMVNLGNNHWNMVSFKNGHDEQLLITGLSENAKNGLFKNLNTLYNLREL